MKQASIEKAMKGAKRDFLRIANSFEDRGSEMGSQPYHQIALANTAEDKALLLRDMMREAYLKSDTDPFAKPEPVLKAAEELVCLIRLAKNFRGRDLTMMERAHLLSNRFPPQASDLNAHHIKRFRAALKTVEAFVPTYKIKSLMHWLPIREEHAK